MKRGADVCGMEVRYHRVFRARAGSMSAAARCAALLLGACSISLLAPPRPVEAAPVQNPDNRHYYEAIARSGGTSWNAANEAASARTYEGMRGYLATITSPDENQFIIRAFPQAGNGRYCLGGFQLRGIRDPMAGWQWATGEPWSYTNWNRLDGGEPNDYYGLGTGAADENKLQLWENTGGRWNDVRPTVTNESIGYVVEYAPDPPPNTAPVITGYSTQQARDVAVTSAVPGTLLRITGTNLGREGTVIFEGIPHPAAVATWSPTEILLWTPTAPSYPFEAPVTVITDRQRGEGSLFTITAPTPGRDNLLANGSFEFPDSSPSDNDAGYTYGIPLTTNASTFNGYSIPGWRIPFGTIDVIRVGWRHAPGQGSQSIDLVGTPYAGIIAQSFYTQVGRDYTFSCWLAHNPGVPGAVVNLYLNNELEQWLRAGGNTTLLDMGWGRISFRFRANASQTTLTLQDVTGRNHFQGMALDGLSLTQAPA